MKQFLRRTLSSMMALTLVAALAAAPALATDAAIDIPTTLPELGEEVRVSAIEEAPAEEQTVSDDVFLAAVEDCVKKYMKSPSDASKQARVDVVRNLLAVGKIVDKDIYFDLFKGCRNASDFSGYYNAMIKASGLYGYTVGAAMDGTADRESPSRWLEAGNGDRYYTYSAQDVNLPGSGVPYTADGALEPTGDTRRQVSRLLAAGYPLDLYGLAGKLAADAPNEYKANQTQELLFKLLGQKNSVNEHDPYVAALYQYATGADELTPVDKVTVALPGKLTLTYDEASELYSAHLPVEMVGTVERMEVTAIPAGAEVLADGKKVRVGDSFDPAMPITVTATGAELVSGSFAVKYVSYEIVNNNMGEFVTYDLSYTTSGEEALPYAGLVGYQVEPVYGAAQMGQFTLVGGPKPSPLTIDFSYVVPEVEGVAAAPAGVSLPAVQSQDNAGIRYVEPTPVHGLGEIPEGFAFHGWYTDTACTEKAVSNTIFSGSTTLYGYWTYEAPAVVPPTPPETTTYKITVKYVDLAGETLADEYTVRKNAGSRYDVTEQAAKSIEGYTIDRAEGAVEGIIRGNVTITVYYKAVTEAETPEIEIPEEEPPLTDLPETEIPGEDIPLAPLPEPAPEEPKADDVIIVDPEVPMGSLPQTGSGPRASFPIAPGLAALALSLALAGAAVVLGKKKAR